MLGNIFKGIDPTQAPVNSANQNLTQAREQFANTLQGSPQYEETPADVKPALRTEDAWKALLLIGLSAVTRDPKDAVEGLKGLMQGKMAKAQGETEQNQRGVQERNQRAQQDYNKQGQLAQFNLQNAENDQKMALQQRQLSIKEFEQQQKEKAVMGYQLNNQWNAANDEGDVMNIAQYAAQNGMPIPEDAVKAKLSSIAATRAKSAASVWEQTLGKSLTDDGFIEEKDIPSLMTQREAIAAQYPGVSLDILRLPKTAQQWAVTRAEQLNAQYDEKAKLSRDKYNQTVAKDKANLELNERRVKALEDRTEAARRRGDFTANTGRMRYELELEKSKIQKDINKTVDTKIQTIDAQIQRYRSQQGADGTPLKKKKELETTIQGLKGEREYWRGQRESVEDPGVAPTNQPLKGQTTTTLADGTGIRW